MKIERKIKVYNTLAQKKEELVSADGETIRIYACGPTVYSSPHIGHARAAVVFDVITKFLKYIGYNVVYVRNITDIDDKIINRANELGVPWEEIAKKYTDEYKQDMKSLRIEDPTHEPRATEHIPQMIELISSLIDKGYAYESGGDVFFSVRKFKDYGKLSKRTPDDMLAGVRIDINEQKEDPLDFALWKGVKPGEPWWESPWGKGRPGWHIECSVMSAGFLGETFEIHGGGKDLIFPHHENEIAQSEAATGKDFVRHWVHNGLININREKMSKSLGNIINVKDALNLWSPEVIRLFFISHQYQNPVDFSERAFEETESALSKLYITLKRIKDLRVESKKKDKELEKTIGDFKAKWVESMVDDFNTADALGHLFDLVRAVNRSIDSHGWTQTLERAAEEIGMLVNILGILQLDPDDYLKRERLKKKRIDITEEEIEKLIEERARARGEKNWEEADKIRSYLASRGITLEDTPQGTIWRVGD